MNLLKSVLLAVLILVSIQACTTRNTAEWARPRSIQVLSQPTAISLEKRFIEEGFEGFFVVEVMIEGQGPFSLILDTGAGMIVLSEDFAGPFLATHPRRSKPFFVVEGDDKMEVGRVFRVADLTLGKIVLEDVAVVTIDFGYWEAPEGRTPPGLIGLYGFQEHFIEIDFQAGEVTIADVAPEALPPVEAALPFRWSGGALYAEITVGDQKTWAVVDSGSSLGLEIPRSLETPTIKPWEFGFNARDIGAMRPYDIAQIEAEVRIGDTVLPDPWVYSSPGLDYANIGIGVLRHFRLTLDTKNGRLWLEGPAEKRLVVEKPALSTKPSEPAKPPTSQTSTPPSESEPDR